MNRLIGSGLLALALIAAACSSGDTPADDGQQTTDAGSFVDDQAVTSSAPSSTTTTTSSPATTATLAETTTTAGAVNLIHGYPVSDEYVVETVITGIDAGTGGLAIAEDGTMYMADFGYTGHPGNTLLRISVDGTVEPFSQHEDMDQLTMTRFAADGTILQSSYGSGHLFRIDEGGNAEVVVDGLRGPTGIVILDDGTLVVEAYNLRALMKVYADGTVEEWVADIKMAGPNGLTMGPDGTIYVIDHKDGGLFAVSPAGELEKLLQFPKSTSHGVYHDGGVFVTSRNGFVVYRYDIETADVVIIAGSGIEGAADGRGAEASFGRLNAITLGPDGALYVNHGGEDGINPVSIRRIVHKP